MLNQANEYRAKLFRVCWQVAACAVFLFFNSQNAFSAEAGTIKGTVRAVAAGGATTQATLIADAKLTLTNRATPDQPLKTTSNASGDFIFENLPAGVYTLTVEANGLAKATQEIPLAPGALLILQ